MDITSVGRFSEFLIKKARQPFNYTLPELAPVTMVLTASVALICTVLLPAGCRMFLPSTGSSSTVARLLAFEFPLTVLPSLAQLSPSAPSPEGLSSLLHTLLSGVSSPLRSWMDVAMDRFDEMAEY